MLLLQIHVHNMLNLSAIPHELLLLLLLLLLLPHAARGGHNHYGVAGNHSREQIMKWQQTKSLGRGREVTEGKAGM